jgi:hypothetical protein
MPDINESREALGVRASSAPLFPRTERVRFGQHPQKMPPHTLGSTELRKLADASFSVLPAIKQPGLFIHLQKPWIARNAYA